MTQSFHHPLVIQAQDIDELGHVNNVVYLRWVQETATAHWRAVASAAMQDRWLWVVLRHEIDYRKAALPGDAVHGRTWVGKAQGVRFDRFVDIRRDDEVLARARTVWCLIDSLNRRPHRIGVDIVELFQPFQQA